MYCGEVLEISQPLFPIGMKIPTFMRLLAIAASTPWIKLMIQAAGFMPDGFSAVISMR
jgi:hypothetical protein